MHDTGAADWERVGWAKASDARYLERLKQSIETRLADGVDLIDWVCPRCGHKQITELDESPVVALDPVKTPSEPRRIRVHLECDCGEEHPGRPADGRGCGYGAKATFTI